MSSVQTSLLNGMNTSGLEKLGLTEAQIAGIMKQTADGITKKTGGGTARVRKERVIPAEGDRCMARTWGSAKAGNLGMGPQCTAKRCGGDYCKMHAKKAAESEEPCQMKDGRKWGLFCGRFDKPIQGKDASGKWQIQWLCPEIQKQIAEEKAQGTFELGENELAHKKSSGPKKPRAKKEKKEKKEKAPKAPRGKNAYMFYLESRRAAIKAQIEAEAKAEGASAEAKEKLTAKGSVKVSEVTKVAGAEWKALAADAKAPFEKLAADDKAKKLAEFAKSQPATPPAAPAVAAPTVDAAALLKSLEVNSISLSPGGNKDVFGSDSEDEDENEGPWCYTLPDEHKLPTPADATPAFDPTDAAVCRIGDKHYVVPLSWYEDAEEDDLENEEELLKVFIGMVNNPVYPEEEGGEITGTYSPKA